MAYMGRSATLSARFVLFASVWGPILGQHSDWRWLSSSALVVKGFANQYQYVPFAFTVNSSYGYVLSVTPDITGQDPDLYCSGSSSRSTTTGALSTVNVKSERWGGDSVAVSRSDSWVPVSPPDVYCTVLGYTAVNFTLQLVDQSPSSLSSPTPSALPSATASATRVGTPTSTATRTRTASATPTRSGSAPASPSYSPSRSASPVTQPAPSNGAVATLAIGGQASGSLLVNDKHYYALPWTPPAGPTPVGVLLTLKPLSSSADPDLAVSQYGPSPSSFISQASSTRGAGITDSLTLSTSAVPLAAVLASGANPRTLYVRVVGYAAGSYLLTTAYIAPSPSPSTPGTPSATPTTGSASPSRPATVTASRSRSALASGASPSRSPTRSVTRSATRTPEPTPSPAVSVKARISVAGATVGAAAVVGGSFFPGDLPHYMDFTPPAAGTWSFKLARTSADGDVGLCVNAAGFRSLVLGPNGVFNWCASAGLAPGAVEELNVTVTKYGATVSLGAGTRRLVQQFESDAVAAAEGAACGARQLQASASPSTAAGPVSLFVRVANGPSSSSSSSQSSSYMLAVAMTQASPDSGSGGDPVPTPTVWERYRWWFVGGGLFVLAMICLGCFCGCACTRKRRGSENQKTQAEMQAQAAAAGRNNAPSIGAGPAAAGNVPRPAPAPAPTPATTARAVYAGLPPAYAPGSVATGQPMQPQMQMQQVEMQQLPMAPGPMQMQMQTPYGSVTAPGAGYPAYPSGAAYPSGYPMPMPAPMLAPGYPSGYPAGYPAAAYSPQAAAPGSAYPVAPGAPWPAAPPLNSPGQGYPAALPSNNVVPLSSSGLRPQALTGLVGYASPSLRDVSPALGSSGAVGGAGAGLGAPVPLASYPPSATGDQPGDNKAAAAARGGIPSNALPFAGEARRTGDWELDSNLKRPSLPLPQGTGPAAGAGAGAAGAAGGARSARPSAPPAVPNTTGPGISLFGPPAPRYDDGAGAGAGADVEEEEEEDPRAGAAVMRGISDNYAHAHAHGHARAGSGAAVRGRRGSDNGDEDEGDVPIPVAHSQRFIASPVSTGVAGHSTGAASLTAQQAAAIASAAATGDATQIAVAAAAALAEVNAVPAPAPASSGAYPTVPPAPAGGSGPRVADL